LLEDGFSLALSFRQQPPAQCSSPRVKDLHHRDPNGSTNSNFDALDLFAKQCALQQMYQYQRRKEPA
jgi:hypothetical protein